MRTLALPDAVGQWSLTSLREKLIKIGAKIVRHGRYVTFQMAEVVIPRDLFADILRRIDRPQTAASPGMSDGTPFLRVTADRIGAPGSPAKMPFRATNAANWSSIIRIGAKMAVIRRRIARRAVSSHTQRAGEGSIWGIPG